MPPRRRRNHPNGGLKSSRLPIHEIGTRMLYEVASMNGRSHDEVCGAAMNTNLSTSGHTVSSFQPNRRSQVLPSQWRIIPGRAIRGAADGLVELSCMDA